MLSLWKNWSYCKYLLKQGHQIYECRSRLRNTPTTSRFEVYFYNYQKYGHRAFECYRSETKPYWPNQKKKNYPSKNTCSKCHKFGHQRKDKSEHQDRFQGEEKKEDD